MNPIMLASREMFQLILISLMFFYSSIWSLSCTVHRKRILIFIQDSRICFFFFVANIFEFVQLKGTAKETYNFLQNSKQRTKHVKIERTLNTYSHLEFKLN